ncbi:MAG: SDR family NAD(P)-dependent oxidoreductase, partial [Shimia sp.]
MTPAPDLPPLDLTHLNGATVIVTGASRGIGEAAARICAAAGANVVLAARSAGDVTRIAGEIGPNARAMPCDVADWAQVAALVDATEEAFGPV